MHDDLEPCPRHARPCPSVFSVFPFGRCKPSDAKKIWQIFNINHCLKAARQRDISNVAFNTDWSYIVKHVAISLAAVSRGIVASDTGSFFIPEIQNGGKTW